MSCHDPAAMPAMGQTDFVRHVDEEFTSLTRQDLGQLRSYVQQLQDRAPDPSHSEHDDLAASMRSLGYLDYKSTDPLPEVGDGLRLNAYELFSAATGAVEIVADQKSPTLQSLHFAKTTLPAGLILDTYRFEPGVYVLTLSSTAGLPDSIARLLVIGKDKPRRDIAFSPSVNNARDAEARFDISRAMPASLSIAIKPGADVRLFQLLLTKAK